MKFKIITLGCKVNTYESEVIREKFIENGFIPCNKDEIADICVINTCSVTNQSDAKSRQMIRQAKKNNEGAIIVACGCSCQNHKENLLDLGVDILIGNKDKSKIVDMVKEYIKSKEKIVKFYDLNNASFEEMMLNSRESKTRAFVKVQDGCNNFCSYCIIPYMRGSLRSKPFDETIKEINDLTNMGHREIVLTGIHTGSYGIEFNRSLTDLIHEISKNPNLDRIRISSIEVTELTDEFLDELANNPKICDHMHIPIQSGSNLILKKMNRKYDLDYFKDKIKKIRNIRPNMSITTDLVVGFPYETDIEFNETINTLEEIRFTKIHTFPFSLRSGTKAEEMMDNKVDDKVKKDRCAKVIELSLKLENEYYTKYIGQEIEVICEAGNIAHTSNYIPITISEEHNQGDVKLVKIDKVDGIKVYGHFVNKY